MNDSINFCLSLNIVLCGWRQPILERIQTIININQSSKKYEIKKWRIHYLYFIVIIKTSIFVLTDMRLLQLELLYQQNAFIIKMQNLVSALTKGRSLCLIILLFLFRSSISVTPIASILEYNRYMLAYSHDCVLNNGALNFHSEYFTSHFTNTVRSAIGVHYSTQNIDARIQPPNLSDNINIEYYLEKVNITTTTLVTQIKGYLMFPLYHVFTFRYLIILDGNPWIGSHIVVQTFTFTASPQLISTSLPTSYNSTHKIKSIVQIRDINIEVTRTDFNADNHRIGISWQAKTNSTQFTLNFSSRPYFQGIVDNQVRLLGIILDTDSLSNDYPNYFFFIQQLHQTEFSSVTNRSLSFSSSLSNGNYLFGLSTLYFHVTSNPSFYFTTNSSGYLATCSYLGNNNVNADYKYSYFAFYYYVCQNQAYPNFNADDKQCYPNSPCNTSYYLEITNNSCVPCRFDCLTCNNSYQCLSCNASNHRILLNYSCIPEDGYFESNISMAISCNTSACKTCTNAATTCTSCSTPYSYFDNNSCIFCRNAFPNCNTCNNTKCISCLMGSRYINSTFCNLPCTDKNCYICNNSNISICYQCRYEYILDPITIKCYINDSAVCGNGKLELGQGCDDGNLEALDGCGPNCLPEQGYKCYSKYSLLGYNYTNYCAYTKPIQFTPISIEKLQYSNEITIFFSVTDVEQKFWKRSVLKYCFIQTPIPYRNLRIDFIQPKQSAKLLLPLTTNYPQKSLIKMTFEYLQSMQDQTVNFSFNFNTSADLTLVEIPIYNVAVNINPGNNKYAHLYSQNVYQNAKLVYNVCLFLSVSELGLLMVSLLIGGKRIIVEMLITIQLAYICLITVPVLNPIFSALTVLSTANNGYNMLSDPSLRPFEDVLSNQRIKGMQLYSQFLYNINTGLFFIILPLLTGFIVFVTSKIKSFSEQTLKKVQRVYQLALGEYTYIGLLFASCIIGAASVIEIKFGMADISTMPSLFSLVAPGILLLLYPLYGVIRVKCPHMFDEYQIELSENSIGLHFQLIFFFTWLLMSALLCQLCTLWFISTITSVTCFLLYIVTLIKPIFKKQIDRYRTQLNLLTATFIPMPYLYQNIRSDYHYEDESDSTLMIPTAVVLLLIVNFLGNFSFFAYEAFKKVRQCLLGKPITVNKQKDDDEIRTKNALMNSLNNIKNYKLSFIEVTQKEEDSYRSITSLKKTIIPLKNDQKGFQAQEEQIKLAKGVIQEDYIHSKYNEIDQL